MKTLNDVYLSAGPHKFVWDTEKFKSGMYYVKLVADEIVEYIKVNDRC